MRRLGGRGLLLGLAAAAAAAAARWLGWWSDRAGLRLFVPEELARYRGGPGAPGLYLALLGRVYDVSPGRRHYEPGAHYSGFAGRDASRAFVTGDYSEAGLVDDVSDLSFSEVLTLQNWLSFYEKNYELVGRVIGRFYGEDGLPTPTLTRVEAVMARGAEAGQRALQEKQKFPPCNAEWSSGRGSRLWCSTERWISCEEREPGLKAVHLCVHVSSTSIPGMRQEEMGPLQGDQRRREQRLGRCPQEAVQARCQGAALCVCKNNWTAE
ncbi:neuferricin isoform X1 [Vulpes lagopus]|uniref:neuferricin isoform X1 n=1 Tax=Vulpes lagopus TaxID=494514 RepID=UPI001BC9B080|nr:neuferricin isoform X1 [Vulpes lagopus]